MLVVDHRSRSNQYVDGEDKASHEKLKLFHEACASSDKLCTILNAFVLSLIWEASLLKMAADQRQLRCKLVLLGDPDAGKVGDKSRIYLEWLILKPFLSLLSLEAD